MIYLKAGIVAIYEKYTKVTPIEAKGLNTILAAVSCINLITPCTDYLDVIIVLFQVPKGAKIIGLEDGFYWYEGN
jgi:hypothetical protein